MGRGGKGTAEDGGEKGDADRARAHGREKAPGAARRGRPLHPTSRRAAPEPPSSYGLRDLLPGASAISAIREPLGPTHEFLVSGYLSVYESGSCAATQFW